MSHESVYGTCLVHAKRCLPRDPALEPADLVQAAFLKVGDRLETTRPEYEQIAYLCMAIGQIATDHHRRAALRRRVPLSPATPARDDVAHEAQVAADLAAALASPRRGLAEAVLLGLGYTITEIAALRDQPAGTVKTNIWSLRHAGVRR